VLLPASLELSMQAGGEKRPIRGHQKHIYQNSISFALRRVSKIDLI
jgi:hypothetical protein